MQTGLPIVTKKATLQLFQTIILLNGYVVSISKKNKKYIGIVENGEQIKYTIENISDIYGYTDKLVQRLQSLDMK